MEVNYFSRLMLVGLAIFMGCGGDSVLPGQEKVCYPITVSPYEGWEYLKLKYDSNRIMGTTYPGGGISDFEYDVKGRLVSLGSSTYSYDAQDRVTKIVIYVGGNPNHVKTLSYAYNGSGQLSSETTEVSGIYDPPIVYTVYYQYSTVSTNNFSSIEAGTSILHFEYDDKPNPLKRLGVFGRIFNPIYDFPLYFTDNNITKIRAVSPTGEQEAVFSYTYNDQGYPVQVSRAGVVERKYTYECQ